MGKDAPAATPAPDPYATSRAQTSSNVSTAIANTVLGNANETGPLGSVQYRQNGSYQMSEPVLGPDGKPTVNRRWVSDDPSATTPAPTIPGGTYETTNGSTPGVGAGRWVEDAATTTRDIPIWERITTLSPEQQALYDGQVKVQKNLLGVADTQSQRLAEVLGQPLTFDGISDPKIEDFGDDRLRVEQAMYDRLNPQLDRDRAALETQLTAQGFTRGTEAFQNELDSANRQANDARLAITAAGGQEQSRLVGLAATQREREIQERMALRSSPINEISALLGQSQVSMPTFSPYQAGTIAGTPVGDYVYRSADINQKNDQMAAQQAAATNGGLFSLGSAALGGLFSGGTAGFAGSAIGKMVGSDRRIKTAIRLVGKIANGLPLYVFRYIAGGPVQLGLMAQDVETVCPDAVREFFGVKMVDYEMASR